MTRTRDARTIRREATLLSILTIYLERGGLPSQPVVFIHDPEPPEVEVVVWFEDGEVASFPLTGENAVLWRRSKAWDMVNG